MTWKPIETAPKDGTWLDVWVEHDNGAPAGRWTNISWSDGAWRSPSFSSVSPGIPGHVLPGEVTHWRHQPKSPEEEAKELIAGDTLSFWKYQTEDSHSNLKDFVEALERS